MSEDNYRRIFNKCEYQEALSSDDEPEDEETLKAKLEIYENLPPMCGGRLPKPYKPGRDPEPTRVIPPDECFGPCPRIITREQWGAAPPKSPPEQMMFRVRPSVFKKTETWSCSDVDGCVRNIQLLQIYQMHNLGFTDIAYSFMIGEDGNIYEGRGWANVCEKERGFMGIGFLGYYTDEGRTRPTDEMLQLAYDLIMCGVRKGFIANPFVNWGEGEDVIQMMRDYIECEEDVDYSTKVEDPGIY